MKQILIKITSIILPLLITLNDYEVDAVMIYVVFVYLYLFSLGVIDYKEDNKLDFTVVFSYLYKHGFVHILMFVFTVLIVLEF